jgi:hypothetical protein
MGAPDPENADLYELIQQLIDNSSTGGNVDIALDIPYPDNTLFVSPLWSTGADIDPEFLFTSLQAAIDAAAPFATEASPYTIIIYAGTYPAVTLAPNVNLRGADRGAVTLAGINYTVPSTQALIDSLSISQLNIEGPVVIDTSAKVAATYEHITFNNVGITGSIVALVRSGATATGDVAIDGFDYLTFLLSELNLTTFSFTTTGGIASSGVLNMQYTYVSTSGTFLINGSIPPPVPLIAKKTNRTPGRVRRFKNSNKHIQLLPAAPVNSAAFFFGSGDMQLFGGTITHCNSLVETAFISSNETGADSTLTVNGGVFNASAVSWAQDALLALGLANSSSLINCSIDQANFSATGGAVADRTLSVYSVPLVALTDDPTRFGASLVYPVPFAATTYAAAATIVAAGPAAVTAVVPTAQVKTVNEIQLALSSAAVAAATVDLTISQNAVALPFV